MADEEPQAPSKKETNLHLWLGLAMLAMALLAIVLIVLAAVVLGDRLGAGSGMGMITNPRGGGQTGGGGSAGGTGACTWAEVSKNPPGSNLVSISVPVWQYVSQNQKIPSTKSLKVNQNCADSIRAIFEAIYNSSDQPPISFSDTGCYSYRGAGSNSRHNWGAACDINWDENWCHYCYCKGGNVGNFWKPGDVSPDNTYDGWSSGYDIRSIPLNGTIASAFQGQNWGRGLYNCFNDFMHFSVDGH